MTPDVIRRWLEVLERHDIDGISGLLAEDATFYSPAVFTPQHGHKQTLAYLTAAAELLATDDFEYVGQWFGERSAVLEFTTLIGGKHVNGVDIIAWNDDEKIVSFKVMLRPLRAFEVVMPRMLELLQRS